MLINRYKLAKADTVLSILNGITLDEDKDRLYLEAYCNCREQGYHIHNLDNQRAVSFSENRNSDQIVVYPGLHQFFHDGNVPDENVYNNKKYFDNDAYEEAAEWITNYLIKGET